VGANQNKSTASFKGLRNKLPVPSNGGGKEEWRMGGGKGFRWGGYKKKAEQQRGRGRRHEIWGNCSRKKFQGLVRETEKLGGPEPKKERGHHGM